MADAIKIYHVSNVSIVSLEPKLTKLTKMTKQKIIDGFENFTGALSKKKIQGVYHMTVTRRKKVPNFVRAVLANEKSPE